MKICSIKGCIKQHEAKGYCSTHYARFRRNGSPALVISERDTDLSGRRFGRLTAIAPIKVDGRPTNWECVCDCGGRVVVGSGAHLLRGNTKSCGCLKKDGSSRSTHGSTGSPEYNTWLAMKKRCFNPNESAFENYGGRGISVCDEWVDNFEAFMRDMGPRPAGTSLDRIDNGKGYSKENCRWATRTEQNTNKRSNWLITAFGRTLLLKEWSELTGINRTTIAYRIRELGWTPEKAVSKPTKIKSGEVPGAKPSQGFRLAVR